MGEPLAEKSSIKMISKTKILIPSTLIYTKSVYHKKNLEEYLLEAEDSIRYSYI
jgi:hypothetical protein